MAATINECRQAPDIRQSESTGSVRLKVTPSPNTPALDGKALQAFCTEQLSGDRRLKRIVFRTGWLKTDVGMFLRRALRDDMAAASAGKAAWGRASHLHDRIVFLRSPLSL
jgi:acyl-CoA synthetase (AMP-forming)/AMP-acid ligase II